MGNSGRIASSKVDFLPQPLGVLPIFGDSASLSFSPTYIIAPRSNSSSYRSKSFYAGCSVQYSDYYQCLMNISMNSCKESTRKNSRLCVEFWRKRFPNVSEECFVGGTLMDNCAMYDLDYVLTNVDHSNNSVKYDLTSVSQLDEKWIPQRVLFLKKPVCRLQLSKSNELLNSCTFNTPEIDISTSKSVTIYCTPTANFSSLETISPPEICSCEGQCIQPRKRHDNSIEQARQNCPNNMRIVVIMDNLTTIEDAFLENSDIVCESTPKFSVTVIRHRKELVTRYYNRRGRFHCPSEVTCPLEMLYPLFDIKSLYQLDFIRLPGALLVFSLTYIISKSTTCNIIPLYL